MLVDATDPYKAPSSSQTTLSHHGSEKDLDEAFKTISDLALLEVLCQDEDCASISQDVASIAYTAPTTNEEQRATFRSMDNYQLAPHSEAGLDEASHPGPHDSMDIHDIWQDHTEAWQELFPDAEYQLEAAEDGNCTTVSEGSTRQSQDSSQPASSSIAYMSTRERTSDFWNSQESSLEKRKMRKRYKELTGDTLNDNIRRIRLRSRCTESIKADLLADDLLSGQRAVRNLDFQLGLEKVFCGSEKLKLRDVIVSELHVDPHTARTVLSYGMAAMSKEEKAYYGQYGISNDATYLALAKRFKQVHDDRHREESRLYGQRNAERKYWADYVAQGGVRHGQ